VAVKLLIRIDWVYSQKIHHASISVSSKCHDIYEGGGVFKAM
jgi:hypothetical protein